MPRELGKHLIVSSAAADGISVTVHAYLKDRAGIIGHSAHERRIEFKAASACGRGCGAAHYALKRRSYIRTVASKTVGCELGNAHGVAIFVKRDVFFDRRFIKVLFDQLALHAVKPDLVHLVKRDKYLIAILGLESAIIRADLEQAAVVYADGEIVKAQLAQHTGRRRYERDLGKLSGIAEYIYITLCKLTEAPLLRAVGAPDIADLHCHKGRRQLCLIVGIVS
ncbi:unknown [Anaerotruncus sp. CAG:390]|nr:unknown [Anaerotruncus sp. CAG:390]